MAVPPISPVKNEVAAAARKASAKRKRPASSTPQSPAAGAGDASLIPASKRNKSPGVRVVGGRVYDSERGKTCHQCRQKTMDFYAACSNERCGNPCSIRFCHKCLLNRYGEKAEEVAAQEGWNCPKCRGICNCSFCMKKKGQQPTGILVHTARATGYSSVSEMLRLYQMQSESKEMDGDANAAPANLPPPSKQQLVASERTQGKENFRATGKVKRKLETEGRVSQPSEEKIEIADAGMKRKSKTSKIKGEKGNGIERKPRKHNTKENKVAKKVVKEDFGRCQKKDVVFDERRAQSTDRNGKDTPKLDRKIGSSGAMQSRDGTKATGDLRKGVSKETKKSTKSKQMDIRKVLSDGVEKDLVNKKKGDGPEVLQKLRKECMRAITSVGSSLDSVVVLPEATRLTAVAGIDLQVENVGPALQFLEFCSAFGKVLDIKKGQPEAVLRELACGRGVRRGVNSMIVLFYVKLLSSIQKEKEERSPSFAINNGTWLKALKKCVTESQCKLEDLPVDWINKGADGYALLDSSVKLRLLNFLCDELLGTEEIRSWMDKENTEFVEEKKEAREKVLSAKEEEKRLKKKMRDEVAETMLQLRNGAPLTISEHNELVSKIKRETEKAHSEVLGSLDVLRQKKQRSGAVRTEPILLEGDGRAFWRLKSNDSSRILLQDISNWDRVVPQDQWFTYDDSHEKLVEKYVYSSRNKRIMRRKTLKTRFLHGCEDFPRDDNSKDNA